jgi:hypothetical protein
VGTISILVLGCLLVFGAGPAGAQVIEFQSGGLTYFTQTHNGVTVMFAQMPTLVRDFAVMQVAVSNGSTATWEVKPEDFVFRRPDGSGMRATSARDVVVEFMERGGRSDVIKLVTAYEMGLYGMSRVQHSTNGYQSRRDAALAEVASAKIKAAATASAIALVPIKLKPGESTDGAVFYANAGRPLGPGKLTLAAFGSVFEFEVIPPPVAAP